MPIKKNEEYIVKIIDNGYEGEGIAKIDNFTVFVPNSIKGEIVKILIVKVLSSHAFGKIIEIIKTSSDRINADCSTYKRCGGCNLRHIKYEETLEIKQNTVQNLINKNLETKIDVEKTVKMENPYHYRNKVQFPVGLDKNGTPQIGVFANRSHEIIAIENCLIQNKQAQEIAKSIFKFLIDNNISVYDEKTRKGLLRHIVIKVGVKTNQYMCIVVINGKKLPCQEKLIAFLTENFDGIETIIINSNMKNTNVILGETNQVIYGNGYIKDILEDFEFQISPFSFYQVNPIQAEKLYLLAVKNADISKDDIVFDLYCGIGTISLFLAKFAKKVYGIEIVDEAVKMAKENAINNKIENTEFIAGDVETHLKNLLEKNVVPDVVLVDPPRKGLDQNSINNIIDVRPKKIVYISCNPATLIRDLHEFEKNYNITKVTPVDMFPFTSHVECCSVLSLKDSIQ